MDMLEVIVATLNATPSQTLTGHKRLQNIIHLLELAGTEIDGIFRISQYGPYSELVTIAIEELAFQGIITQTTHPTGPYQTLQAVYTIGKPFDITATTKAFSSPHEKDLVAQFPSYSTLDLEIASTIGFFEKDGLTRVAAKEKTQEIKPRKAIPSILGKAEKILSFVSHTRQAKEKALA